MASFFIVDDEPAILDLCTTILNMFGQSVAGVAYNGVECLQDIGQLDTMPDYILMDQRMPKINGVSVTKKLLKSFPDLKIYFISADLLSKQSALAAGASGFIAKPFTIKDFERFLKSLPDTNIS